MRHGNCPCCGAELLAPRLLVSLERNRVAYDGHEWKVRPQLAEFLYTLNEAWPKSVPYHALTQALWGGGVLEPIHARRMLAIYASLGRKILRSFGGNIENSYSRGYRLTISNSRTFLNGR